MFTRKVWTWFLIFTLLLPLWPASASPSPVQAAPEVVLPLPIVTQPLTGPRDTAAIAPTAPTVNSWIPTGSMSVTRYYPTTVLLLSGKVLVVGGCSNLPDHPFCSIALSSAELYDPVTGQWSNTGDMNVERDSSAAVLLANGKVLIAGGSSDTSGSSPLSDAEIYDPATGQWSITGSMNIARDNHTMTLLPNGKVLAVGGRLGLAPSSAELYDPATGLWSMTGDLNYDHWAHSAVLLPDGQVLAISGRSNTSELYNPATGQWTITGNLSVWRHYPAAVLMKNGKVLVTGGSAGCSYCSPHDSAEVYDPATGQWSSTGNMITPRMIPALALLPTGEVLAAGGCNNLVDYHCTNYFADTEIYDPNTGIWSATGNMGVARVGNSIALLQNGMVLVAGGFDGSNTLSSAELYALPSLTAFTPNIAASNAGDLPVLITGAALHTPISATLDATVLLSVTLESPSVLHAVVPVGSLGEGVYTLTVHSDGTPLTLTNAFTVTAPVAATQFRVMVVLACDNNLETHCRRLVNEFELAMLADPDLRIVVLWDGVGDGDTAYMLIQPDANTYTWATYEDGVNRFPLGELDTGDASTLVNFAAWAQAQYPGHYTMLSLVGHGGGWGPDMLPPQPDEYEFGPSVPGMLWDTHPANTLSTRGLADALAWLTAADALDVVYLDGCLMGQAEVLAEVGFAGDYLIAHESLTYARYPYADYFNVITDTTQPADFVQHIADTYTAKVLSEGYPGQIGVWRSATFSATVLPALDTFSSELLATLPTATTTITTLIALSAHVDENNDGQITSQDAYVDLYDFATRVIAHPDLPQSLKDAAQALLDALDAAVVTHTTRSGRPYHAPGTSYWNLDDLHGLSIYLPLFDEWRRPLYGENALPIFAAATHWDEVVQSLFATSMPPDDPGDDDATTPLGNALLISSLDGVGLNQTAYVPVVAIVHEISGIVTIQITITSSNILVPAADLAPRIFNPETGEAFFPVGSFTYTMATADGWAVMLTLPAGHAPISGTAVLVELPFRAQKVGCADLRFATHLLVNDEARAVTHNALPGRVCVTDKGAVSGTIWLHRLGERVGVAVTLAGPNGVFTTTTDANGAYTVTNILSGATTLTFTYPLHLHAVRNLTVTAGTTTTLTAGLWAGDMDSNHDIAERDWYICAAASDPVNDPTFDLNGDIQTDALDCTLLWSNISHADPRMDPPQNAISVQTMPHPAVASHTSAITYPLSDAETQTWKLRTQITGTLQSVGTRITLPAGATVTVETTGPFTNGIFWHQDGTTLYLVAVATTPLTRSTDVARLHLRTVPANSVLTVEAVNLIAEREKSLSGQAILSPDTQIFLPLVLRAPAP